MEGPLRTPLGLVQCTRRMTRSFSPRARRYDFPGAARAGLHSRLIRGVSSHLEGKQRIPLSSRVPTGISWSPQSGLKGVRPPVEFEECGTRGSLRTMHGGGSAPSCCAFPHRVAFEEGSVFPNSTGGLTPFRPLSELQEIPVATREESGILCLPSR